MPRFWKGILLTAFAGLTLGAAEIAAVKFDQQGADPIPTDMLYVTLRLRQGMEFKREYLDEDIKNLFATGKVADVVSEVQHQNDGKVVVIFKIKPSPVISMLKITGNAKFSTKDLLKNFTVTEGDRLSSRNLNETLENLRKFYIGKGYNDVRIPPPSMLPDGKGGVIVTIKIEENLRLKVNKVSFEGAKVFSERELRNVLANSYSYWTLLPFINDYLNNGLLQKEELAIT